MNPLVSILIPTYNRPDYFEEALKSALNQTYDNIEIIVCDNSDNDLTGQVVQKYLSAHNGSKIRYVKNATNIGPIANQQQCLNLATGEYINYLMDDDMFHPEKVEKMVPYFVKNSDVTLVTSVRRVIDKDGKRLYVPPLWTFRKLFEQDTVIDGKRLNQIMLRDKTNYIGEPTTAMFRRKALDEPFGVLLGQQVYFAVDLAAWAKLLHVGKGVYLTKPLSYLRYHDKQLSQHEMAKDIAKLDQQTFINFAKAKGYDLEGFDKGKKKRKGKR
ncbi:glycosyltransferase family 2 protein [Paenibacillus hodogayensis]|uniref:Glycosyltransferase family 2 protein n=1 Tax=Paenibacillus hodogayensis TaxID=279208 RepID=A0ABV5W2J8_9BACL